MDLSYEASKKHVYKGLYLLAIITLVEVFASLLSKGYLGIDFSTMTTNIMGHSINIPVVIISLVIIYLSFYKARYIVFEFMHLKYEAKGLAWSIIFPCGLLIWAIIAFFQEGNAWKERRQHYLEVQPAHKVLDNDATKMKHDEETLNMEEGQH